MPSGDHADWASARTLTSDDAKKASQDPEATVEAGPPGELPSSLGQRIGQRLLEPGRPPPQVGRFFIQKRLGTGGMGSVFAGLDPELSRKVAVKVLNHDATSDRARLRLRREAQALAQLSHPNVVPVYEVGEHEGHTFVAMELVPGEDLRRWLDAAKRSWTEILGVFRQAGEGLAAAHEAGLVHRDFKPHNVIVGADGRVRVVDFGLATDGSVESTPESSEDEMTRDSSLTHTGELLGTPAYMSPEQFGGGTVGPESDQFSYCVALFQALTGFRPFAGDSLTGIAHAVLEEPPAMLPSGPYPEALRPILERGLSREPGNRYPNMRALLAALARVAGEAPPRRSRSTILLGVATIGLAGALAWVVVDSDNETPPPAEPAAASVEPPEPATEIEDVAVPTPAPPPDGDPPDFDILVGSNAAQAREHYQAGCDAFVAQTFIAAAASFGLAADAYDRAQGPALGRARVRYAQALAHLRAWERHHLVNDLQVAYELLRRLTAAGPADPTDTTYPKIVAAHEAMRDRVDLEDGGIHFEPDPKTHEPSRFALFLLDEYEPGTEISVDGDVVGFEPITIAIDVDRGGFTIVARHPAFFDSFSMVNPQGPDTLFNRQRQNPLGPDDDRDSRDIRLQLPIPDEMLPPKELLRPEDWPR